MNNIENNEEEGKSISVRLSLDIKYDFSELYCGSNPIHPELRQVELNRVKDHLHGAMIRAIGDGILTSFDPEVMVDEYRIKIDDAEEPPTFKRWNEYSSMSEAWSDLGDNPSLVKQFDEASRNGDFSEAGLIWNEMLCYLKESYSKLEIAEDNRVFVQVDSHQQIQNAKHDADLDFVEEKKSKSEKGFSHD